MYLYIYKQIACFIVCVCLVNVGLCAIAFGRTYLFHSVFLVRLSNLSLSLSRTRTILASPLRPAFDTLSTSLAIAKGAY